MLPSMPPSASLPISAAKQTDLPALPEIHSLTDAPVSHMNQLIEARDFDGLQQFLTHLPSTGTRSPACLKVYSRLSNLRSRQPEDFLFACYVMARHRGQVELLRDFFIWNWEQRVWDHQLRALCTGQPMLPTINPLTQPIKRCSPLHE